MSKYSLEIVVFITGASVMVLELAGSRVLSPYLGTSIIVWTSLIGVVLGSLSIGYFLGGKLADKKPSYNIFSLIIFGSAIFIAVDALVKDWILFIIQQNILDLRIGSIISTTILFSLPTILLGMVTPYAVRLKLKDLKKSGKTVGNLYAISTIGSILGTFLTGFFLISTFGNTKILLITAIVLVIASTIAYWAKMRLAKFFSIIVIFSFLISFSSKGLSPSEDLIDVDTQYNRVWIYDSIYKNKEIRAMKFDAHTTQSAMFLSSDELVFDYTKFYNLAAHFNPNFEKTLKIGGAAYSYPKEYLKRFKGAEIDVVEIDPKLTELAKKYFRLSENSRLEIFHEDARNFLNRESLKGKKYDLILGDAFSSSFSIPYHLTTQEAVKNIHELLNDDGVAFVNIISSIEGENGKFLRAEYKTYKSVFPQVFLFPVDSQEGQQVQNVLLVALKSEEIPSFKSSDSELGEYLSHLWTKEIKGDEPILTDEFAPVDNYLAEILLDF